MQEFEHNHRRLRRDSDEKGKELMDLQTEMELMRNAVSWLSYSLVPVGPLLTSAEELSLSDVRRIGIQVSINVMSLQSSELEKT